MVAFRTERSRTEGTFGSELQRKAAAILSIEGREPGGVGGEGVEGQGTAARWTSPDAVRRWDKATGMPSMWAAKPRGGESAKEGGGNGTRRRSPGRRIRLHRTVQRTGDALEVKNGRRELHPLYGREISRRGDCYTGRKSLRALYGVDLPILSFRYAAVPLFRAKA